MNLFTSVPFPDVKKKIDYQSRLVFMGSCFAEEIGGWLRNLKFTSHINPYGITYNPISIVAQIREAIEERNLSQEFIMERDGVFFHPDFHSSMNRSSTADLLKNAEECRNLLRKDLVSADFLFLTFGSSIAFEWNQTGEVINNCHRLPSNDFTKVMLAEDRMTSELIETIEKVKRINPKVEIILTVSPVRHLRHGAVQNQRSKARLLILCENIATRCANCTYLPIYELVMDELRDYRFYRQDDLIHLNEGGLDIIKDRFRTGMINSSCFPTIRKVEKWRRLVNHRIQNEGSEEAKKFKQQLIGLTKELDRELSGRFTDELKRLRSS